MMTILSKFLVLPFYPTGLTVVLLILAIVFLAKHRQKTGIALVVCALVQLYAFSTCIFSEPLVRNLEKQYRMATTFPLTSAIVLLSGGEVAKGPPRLYDETNQAGDRILYAGRLAKQGAAPRLIITGGNIDFLRPIMGSQAQAAGRICTELLGVDSSMILFENRARNTYENALFTRQLLDSLGLPRSVILVTSALHMPRSVALFKKQEITVFPAPVDFLADEPPQLRLMSFFPTSGALDNSSNALHEIYGSIAYKLLGRL